MLCLCFIGFQSFINGLLIHQKSTFLMTILKLFHYCLVLVSFQTSFSTLLVCARDQFITMVHFKLHVIGLDKISVDGYEEKQQPLNMQLNHVDNQVHTYVKAWKFNARSTLTASMVILIYQKPHY